MELQPSDSLKIIQEIIQQRKQKYEANGFFLLFWGALIALSGIVQFTMLISNFYPKQSGMVWAVLGEILPSSIPFFMFSTDKQCTSSEKNTICFEQD